MMAPEVYNIPAGRPFADDLARGLMDRFSDGPFDLSDVLLLLPTRRSQRALQDAFLRQSAGQALLLPTMRPLGDIDDDEIAPTDLNGAADLSVPPAITPLRRQLLLAELVNRARSDVTPAQAGALAKDLAAFIDLLATFEVPHRALENLVGEDFSKHWRETLKFLQLVGEPWDALVRAEGCMEPAARRDLLARTLCDSWQKKPPETPVIAAGSTGSLPATRALLRVIASMSNGFVVLPGMDGALDDEAWDVIDDNHPQFNIKMLLEHMALSRAEVVDWPAAPSSGGDPVVAAKAPPSPRNELLSRALRPAAASDAWPSMPALPLAAMDGLSRIDCAGPRQEATVIALLLREALEDSENTAALVTPDRGLARRVGSELLRWGIAVDDSAGVSLAATAPGAMLRLVTEATGGGSGPVDLLALLKHPLVLAGLPAGELRGKARGMERAVLRGPRPEPGFAGLFAALRRSKGISAALLETAMALAEAAADFTDLSAAGAVSPQSLLRAHVGFAEWLSLDDTGEIALWRGESGEAVARFIHDLHQALTGLPDLEGRDYAAWFTALLQQQVLRPRYGRHPRLHIWGPMEARLQQADLMILGGLNEGTWPAEATGDPWLNRPMRKQLGLPPPEQRIGLSAHDFVQAAAAPKVVLTRAGRVDGAPTVPSRWLSRLDRVMAAGGLSWPEQRPRDLAHWEEAIDRPRRVRPVLPPRPKPPLAARPDRLSVTRIETWMKDPYVIYARYILQLEALDEIDAEPTMADRGTVIHRALEQFVTAYPGELPAAPLAALLSIGRLCFAEFIDHAAVRAFWWPRFERVAAWFVTQEQARRAQFTNLAVESRGSIVIPSPVGQFELIATADRIDRDGAGNLHIIDYKTGMPPSEREIIAGDAPQLPLEAAMARAGGFSDVAAGPVAGLEYWRLSGGRVVGEIRTVKRDVNELADEALAGLGRLVDAFADPGTPYRARPRPEVALRYNDYEHLARIKEWAIGGLGDEG